MQPSDCDIHTAVRIVIVDDHLMFRRGVRAVLETYAEQVDVLGEAATADEGVALVVERVPNLVLLDLQLPERFGVLGRPAWEHGVSAITRIRRVSPLTRILVLSYLEDPDILFAALRAGAHGYITKGDPYDGAGLVDAIRRTMAGEAFYGAVVAQLIREYHQHRRPEDQPPEPLTRREVEVLDLLVDRKSNFEIAEQLVISVKTVKTHVANILAKLHLESRHEIPVYVRLRGRARAAS
jgi:two-component system, NarL family, response regulator LiaR